jgi:CRP/FNR family transcriptional regulator, cyclic AMP receptor protein
MANEKIIFLVADGNAEVIKSISDILKKAYDGCTIYSAFDGKEALAKMENVVPHILVTNVDLPRISGIDLLQGVVREKKFASVGVIAICDVPEPDPIADDVVRGKIKTVPQPVEEKTLLDAVHVFLSRLPGSKEAEFVIKHLKIGEILFKEGDPSSCAYLLKRGKLQVYIQKGLAKVSIGSVGPGEFVGEMAHITGEPRSAHVEAVEPSELVEIPTGTLDLLIFSKPAWAKALLKTLCKRLKEANFKK